MVSLKELNKTKEQLESIMNKVYYVVDWIWKLFMQFEYKKFFYDNKIIPETKQEIRALQELISQRTWFVSETDDLVKVELFNKLIHNIQYMLTLNYTENEKRLLRDDLLAKLLAFKEKYSI